MKLIHHIVVICISLVLATSCATKIDPVKYDELPKSSGFYGGSLLYDSWVYRGSDQQGNHFTYSWNRDNFVHDRKFIAPTFTIQVDKRFCLTDDRALWKAAKPKLTEEGQLASFEVNPTDWQRLMETQESVLPSSQ
jgi:hypothetical protein